jgi:hypothetical protein
LVKEIDTIRIDERVRVDDQVNVIENQIDFIVQKMKL